MMTLEEAKEILENWNLCHYTPSREAAEMVISALDPLEIISALRPVSREQVDVVINSLKLRLENNEENGVVYIPKFAVERMIERLEAIENG